MCRLRNIAMCDYQESVTTGQTHGRTDRQMPEKVIPMCRYASQASIKKVFEKRGLSLLAMSNFAIFSTKVMVEVVR